MAVAPFLLEIETMNTLKRRFLELLIDLMAEAETLQRQKARHSSARPQGAGEYDENQNGNRRTHEAPMSKTNYDPGRQNRTETKQLLEKETPSKIPLRRPF